MAVFPPQLPDETAKAYEAFYAYCGMGGDRSLEKTRQKLGKNSAGYTRVLETWSRFHDWQTRIREYDASLAADVAAEHTRRYLADLEDHRQRYSAAGKQLYGVAKKILDRLDERAGGMEVTPNALQVASRALTIAADLEAHSLGLDELMGELTPPEATP